MANTERPKNVLSLCTNPDEAIMVANRGKVRQASAVPPVSPQCLQIAGRSTNGWHTLRTRHPDWQRDGSANRATSSLRYALRLPRAIRAVDVPAVCLRDRA